MKREIRADEKITFKQVTKAGDYFYSFSYGETREIDFETQEQYEQEKAALWDAVDEEVGKKIKEVKDAYKQQ